MQIVIPMAGQGLRFINEGYQEPKPLIRVDQKPIIEHIINLFPGEHEFVFICNNEHLKNTAIRQELLRIKPQAKIVGIPVHRLGPVHTVLQAKDAIKNDSPTIICYCDIYVKWDFKEFARQMQEKNNDACLVCFKGFHPPLTREGFYATVRPGEEDLAEEVREKYSFTENKMDSWNSAGMYYFKSGDLVKKYFQQMVDKNLHTNDEYYVSMVHNLLIQDGLKNGIYPVDYFVSWGKPQDVREYLYWSRHFNNSAPEAPI